MEQEQDGLVVRYEHRDTDGTGELGAVVRSGGFAGASAAWFSDDQLLDFADQLLTYPLGDRAFVVSGGHGTDGEGFEKHVALTVRAVGRRGQVGVVAHLATPADQDHDQQRSVSEVRVEVLTSYEELGRFSTELRRLVQGTTDEARLDADVL